MTRLGDTSAFVIPGGQLLLTWRGKTRMYTVGIVFEFYTCAPLSKGAAKVGMSISWTNTKAMMISTSSAILPLQ